MTVTEIKSVSEFNQIIRSGKVVAIDFWAEWCGPCKAISPVFAQCAEKYTNVEFYKVNVDEQEQISQEVGIRAMPTFKVFKDGEQIDELVGAAPAKLEQLLTTAQSRA